MCNEDGVKLATLTCCGKRACASCLGRLKEFDQTCYWCRQYVPERSVRAALNGVEVWPPPRPKAVKRKTDEQRRVVLEEDEEEDDEALAAALTASRRSLAEGRRRAAASLGAVEATPEPDSVLDVLRANPSCYKPQRERDAPPRPRLAPSKQRRIEALAVALAASPAPAPAPRRKPPARRRPAPPLKRKRSGSDDESDFAPDSDDSESEEDEDDDGDAYDDDDDVPKTKPAPKKKQRTMPSSKAEQDAEFAKFSAAYAIAVSNDASPPDMSLLWARAGKAFRRDYLAHTVVRFPGRPQNNREEYVIKVDVRAKIKS
jgi:hypothetical protein